MINKTLGDYGQWCIEMIGQNGEIIKIDDWRDYNKFHKVPASCDFQISICNGCGLGSGFEAVTYDNLITSVLRCCWISELDVQQLNRLCVNEGLPKNTLSWFVSQALKKLKSESLILVSYADEGVGHHGYIYQATNWIYTGKTKQRTDKYTPNGKHSRHYTDEYNHLRKVRTSKHRYVYFTNKKFKPTLNYPKGNNHRYVLGERQSQLIFDKNKGVYYYEY